MTFNAAENNYLEIVNDMAVFGWALQSKRNIRYERNIDIVGKYDEDDGPLVEVMLVFKHNEEYANELYSLSLQYFDKKKAYMNAIGSTIGRMITGLVFGSIITFAGIMTLVIGLEHPDIQSFCVTLGIIFLFFGLPAYPLCICGIVVKKRNEHKAVSELPEDMEILKAKARMLQK